MRYITTFIIICLFGCTPSNKSDYELLLKNGKVIDLESGEVEYLDICISDGRIQQILPSDENTTTRATEIIDLTDKYVLPGFWDNHVHFRGGDSLIAANKNFLKLFLANGITTVRDAGGDLTPSVMEWKEQIGKRKLAGPTIFTSGPKIDGLNARWAGSLEVDNDLQVTTALDSLRALGTDFIKLYDSRISGEVYLKVIEEAEKRGLVTSGHMPFTLTLDAAVTAGIDGIEHLYYIMKGCSANEMQITQKLIAKEIGFWQAMPMLRESYADSTASKTFKSLIENNVFVIPTLHIGRTLSYLDEDDHTNDAYLKYMGSGIVQTYEGRIQRALNSTPEAVQDRKNLDAFFGTLTKSLHDTGVALLAGSDSGAFNSYTYPGISFHKELEAMVAEGIAPKEALKTSAYNGARFLRKTDDYGSITVGKISDLVVLNANPLKDISNTQKIHLVIKGNQIYNSKKLHSLLEEAIIN